MSARNKPSLSPARLMVLLGLGLEFIFHFAPIHAAQKAPVSAEEARQARELVDKLASDNFSERLRSRIGLLESGRAAIEPLENAVKSEDPEVRLRAMEILIALRGRGFLGIGLAETTDADMMPQNEEQDEQQAESTVVAPKVVANQIVNFRQYLTYGVNKPLPAEAAGLQPGDKILSVNDTPVQGVKDLMREVITIGPARQAVLLIERGEQKLRVPVTLTRNPIMMRMNDFGGYQISKDPPPPVDLEKEADLPAGEKQTFAPEIRIPQFVTLDGEEATIQVGELLKYALGQAILTEESKLLEAVR